LKICIFITEYNKWEILFLQKQQSEKEREYIGLNSIILQKKESVERVQDSQKQVKFSHSPRNQKVRDSSEEEDESLQEKVTLRCYLLFSKIGSGKK
jgi:hypothetical protein